MFPHPARIGLTKGLQTINLIKTNPQLLVKNMVEGNKVLKSYVMCLKTTSSSPIVLVTGVTSFPDWFSY